MSRIDLWLKGLEIAMTSTGEIAPWPVHVSIPSIYGGDIEAGDLFRKLKFICQTESQPLEIVSRLFDGPSVAKALLMDVIPSLKIVKPAIPVDQRVWFVDQILQAIELLQAGDIFCLKGVNETLDSNEVRSLYEQTPWIWLKTKKEKEEIGRSFYKTSATTKSLIWSLYFYGWDDVGYEIHGPYKVNDFQLIVTHYFNLKPTPLWPKIGSFPYSSVKLLALYPKAVGLKVDMFIHFFNQGNLLEATKGIYLEANGVPIKNATSAQLLSQVVLKRVMKQHATIKAMGKEEIIKKYIESRYYAFRRWRQYFNEDWRPPQKVFDRIKKWGIIDIPAGKGPTWSELKKAFDPRTNYVPGKPG